MLDYFQWKTLLVKATEAIQTALSEIGAKPSLPDEWESYFICTAIESMDWAADCPHKPTSTFHLLSAIYLAQMSVLSPAKRSGTITIPIGSQDSPQSEMASLTDAFGMARARCAGWLQPTGHVRSPA
jgi:hypothetical protein